jgi:hypothetical protein
VRFLVYGNQGRSTQFPLSGELPSQASSGVE